jgi:putative endonuclease
LGIRLGRALRRWIERSVIPGFTARYGCKLLVWHELHETMENAIPCWRQIKGGSRVTKLALIEALDPNWHDFFEEMV